MSTTNHEVSQLVYRYVIGLFAAIAFLLLLASPASAADGEVIEATTGSVLTISLVSWAIIQGTVLPILVGILTKVDAPSSVKTIINLLLNAVGGLVGVVVISDGVAMLSLNAVVAAGLGFVASIAAHYGFWKPLGVSGSDATTNRLLPSVGLG